jgi:hypothetical protein
MKGRPRRPTIKPEKNPDDPEIDATASEQAPEPVVPPVVEQTPAPPAPEPVAPEPVAPQPAAVQAAPIDDFDWGDDFSTASAPDTIQLGVPTPPPEPEPEPEPEIELPPVTLPPIPQPVATPPPMPTQAAPPAPIYDEPEEFAPTYTEPEEDVEIPYDPESSYFFMFGVTDSGKTVILSGLLYNVLAHRMGDRLTNLNDHTVGHQLRGTVLMDNLLQEVPEGSWPNSTSTLDGDGKLVPRQLNLEFGPKDPAQPNFKFSVMDVSGEDLMNVRVKSDSDHSRLNPGIEAFLKLPENNLAFICIYPAESGLKNTALSAYLRSFIQELDKIGHHASPIIIVISKWDLVEDEYDSPADFLKAQAPIIWGIVNESERDVSLMTFSIGSVDKESGTYVYSPKNSDQLFKWMYHTQMGVELDEDLSASKGGIWNKLFGSK